MIPENCECRKCSVPLNTMDMTFNVNINNYITELIYK